MAPLISGSRRLGNQAGDFRLLEAQPGALRISPPFVPSTLPYLNLSGVLHRNQGSLLQLSCVIVSAVGPDELLNVFKLYPTLALEFRFELLPEGMVVRSE